MRSIRTNLMLTFGALIMTAGLILGIGGYLVASDIITSTFNRQVRTIAEMTTKRIDPAEFQTVVEQIKQGPGDEANRQAVFAMPEYIDIRQELSEIRETNGLKYLYTVIKHDGKFMYVIDGFPLDYTGDDISLPGDVETEDDPSYNAVWGTQKTVVEKLTYSKEWGTTLGAYVPIRDSNGTMIGFVGADFDASGIAESLRQARLRLLFPALIILLVSLVAAYFIAGGLVSPMKKLTQVVSQGLAQGDFSKTV